jgi:hypothetical protein
MNAWTVTKWALLVIAALGLAVGLARVFSGPEDGWVRDAQGNWVEHGHPAGPPPASDYRPSPAQRVLPWAVLGIFALGAVASWLFSARASSSRDRLGQGVRLFGAVSVLAGALALSLGLGLAAAVPSGLGRVFEQATTVVLVLIGLMLFLGLLCAQAYAVKKVLEAHYDLKRATALLQDTLERRRAGDA